MQQRMIALVGPPGVGKTQAAKALCALVGAYERHSFADRLRDCVRFALGMADAQTRGDAKDKPLVRLGGATPRDFLVAVGEACRAVYAETWIDALAQRTRGRDIVIDDLRHANEAYWVRSQGGVVVRLVRDDYAGHPAEEGDPHAEVDADVELDITGMEPVEVAQALAAIGGTDG